MKIYTQVFRSLYTGIFLALFSFLAGAQPNLKVKPNWQNLDLQKDSVFGISTEKAYEDLLKGKPHTTVLVAVIDGGVDINHEDLKNFIWTNKAEIAGNGVDDDKNGYSDDVHGWDFIGSAKGDIQYENLELTRFVRQYWQKFQKLDTTNLSESDAAQFKYYNKLRTDLMGRIQKAQRTYNNINAFYEGLKSVLQKLNNQNPGVKDFENYEPQGGLETFVKKVMVENLGKYKDVNDFIDDQIKKGLDHFKEQLDYHFNITYDPRSIVGDNYEDATEHFYGNNDVQGPDAMHGSHVAGIIGANRDNNLGIKGVANDVEIMSVRTVPNGDERDKDVANAIRYAAANGAKVINMSFGKGYSYNKKAVDDAVKFAMDKDVLIVHAAGNDNNDRDVEVDFPNKYYENNGGEAKAWIEVGAADFKDDETLKASFSNYGQTTVDVFAPGVNIYSTVPNSKYLELSGTSMAAPVVTGLAACIRSYYPKLTALQVKDIILKSVVKVDHKVTLKIKDSKQDVSFSKLCVTGGIVNAYNALKLAATY